VDGPKPGGAASAGAEQRVGQPLEGGVGSAELGLSRYDVVEGPVNRSHAIRQFDVLAVCREGFPSRIPLCNPDLLKDEREV
jgi:hypothetical protein